MTAGPAGQARGPSGPDAFGPYAPPSFGPPGRPAELPRPSLHPVNWNRRALGWIIDFGLQTAISTIASIGMLTSYIPWLLEQLRSLPTSASPRSTSPATPHPALPPASIFAWMCLSYLSLIPWAYLVLYRRWIKGGSTGQSLGRTIAKTRLVSADTGQPIGALMTVVRDLAHVLDSLSLYTGYLWPLWDKRRQTFADKLLTTVVVDEADTPPGIRR